MANLIASTAVGSLAPSLSGRGYQQHLVYCVNSAKWLIFFWSGTNTISVYYSTDLVTWTQATGSPQGIPTAMPEVHSLDGRVMSVAYKSIAGVDVIHILSCYYFVASTWDTRATFSGTTITFAASSQVAGDGGGNNNPDMAAIILDSANRPVLTAANNDQSNNGDPTAFRATNTDAGSSWTAGWGAGASLHANPSHEVLGGCLFDLGGGNVLTLHQNTLSSATDPLTMSNVEWNVYTTSWSAFANAFTALAAGVDANDFGACARTTGDVHCVLRGSSANTNTYTHKRFNGTNWTSLSGASIPNQTFLATTGGFAMASDGTNVWLFVLDTDAASTIRYIKWNGSAWSAGWSALEGTGTQTRNYISCYPVVTNGIIALIYTQVNGTQTNLYATSLSVPSTSFDPLLNEAYLPWSRYPNVMVPY